MNIIITYEGFKNAWTGEILENCVLHHGNLNPKDNYIFGWDYWVGVCESYAKMGYNKVRAIITDERPEISEKRIASRTFILYYEPKNNDLVISF